MDGVAWCESKASSNRHAFVSVCLCSVCMCFPKLMESLHLIGSEHLARTIKKKQNNVSECRAKYCVFVSTTVRFGSSFVFLFFSNLAEVCN